MENRRVYLDHAATTPVAKEAIKAMMPYFSDVYGNASSLHRCGREAKEALEESRKTIAEKLNASSEEIVFTSGGTESNNLALKGVAEKAFKGHIITCAIEHPSILEPCRELERKGFSVTYLGVDRYGTVNPSDVAEAVRKDTILISIAHANNEIGTVQDIAEIGRIACEHGVPFHTDACQSFTKEEIDVKKQSLDLATINAHKIGGPKGVGALYIRKGIVISPQSRGGAHEMGLRAGTENVAGIVGFARAAELIGPRDIEHMKGMRDRLIQGALSIKGTRLNGHPEKRLCNNANFSFSGVEGLLLLMRLDQRGIACSTASACSSHSQSPSHVLLATGLSPEECYGSLRMTLGPENTKEEIDYTLDALREEIDKIRNLSV